MGTLIKKVKIWARRALGVGGSDGNPIAELNRHVASLAASLDEHHRVLDRLEARADVIEAEIPHALQENFRTLAARLDEQRRTLEEIESRVAAAEKEIQPASLLVSQFRTLAFVSDALPLEAFDHPHAGRVFGYREQRVEVPADEAYTYFSDVFRGDAERVRRVQRRYLPLLAGHEPVLDVGCGRGELLGLLRDAGLEYAGVDADQAMVERCQRTGHTNVVAGDAIEHLESLDDGSLGAVVACHVIEHLPARDLSRFVRVARRKLRAQGILIAETVNPYAPPSFRAFWVDPTHEHPVFPETLLAVCRAAGFESAFVFHPELATDVDVDRFVAGAYAIVATAV